MRVSVLLQDKIFVAIILNRIAVGIEQSGPPVSDGATAFIAVFRITYITAWDFQFSATTTDDYVRPFQTAAMMFV